VEDRPSRHRGTHVTGAALPPPIGQPPPRAVPALDAAHAIGPPQPLQVIQAVRLRTKPRLKLPQRCRVMHARSGITHPSRLLRLAGAPYGSISCRAGRWPEAHRLPSAPAAADPGPPG